MRESKDITIEGRVQFDLLQVNILKVSLVSLATIFGLNLCFWHIIQAMNRDYKLSSYSLNSVSAHFLGEQVSFQYVNLFYF